MAPLSVLPRYYNYFKRALRVYPSTVFGPQGQEIMTEAYKKAFSVARPDGTGFFRHYWNQFKNGTKAAGRASEAYAGTFAKKGFWNSMWQSVRTIPKKIAQGWRVGGRMAAKKGAGTIGKFLGSAKGSLAALGKRMPVIGSLLLVAFELPNIFKATKNEGLAQGAVETVKAGARIGGGVAGSSVGAAIGSMIFPGIGTAIGGLVGWIAGEWAAKKIVGKSYSEKQEELAHMIDEKINPTNPSQDGYQTPPVDPNYQNQNPYGPYNPMMFNPNFNNFAFENDFMYNANKHLFDMKA